MEDNFNTTTEEVLDTTEVIEEEKTDALKLTDEEEVEPLDNPNE